LIIVFGDNGQVLKQGSFAELRNNADDFTQIGEVQIAQTDQLERRDELVELHGHIADSICASSTDIQRQTTDLAVYKYYFSALGWFRVFVLLLLLISDAGMSGFRCKL
jgi:ATP-binding cassette subfamily C (CFTR/MRP) protein 1